MPNRYLVLENLKKQYFFSEIHFRRWKYSVKSAVIDSQIFDIQ